MENIGKSFKSTPSVKSDEVKSTPKTEQHAPVEDVKKFEDLLKKKDKEAPKEAKENKKEGESIFNLIKKNIPEIPKKVSSDLPKDKVVQAAAGEVKKQFKSDAEMKIEKGPKDNLAKSFEKDKIKDLATSDKTTPSDKTKDLSSLNKANPNIKPEKKEEKPTGGGTKKNEEAVPALGQPLQQSGPFGQPVAPVTNPQQSTSTSTDIQAMAQLASTMLTKMQASHEISTAGKPEVRMSFSGDAHPMLKNAEATLKFDDKGVLNVTFSVKTLEAQNFIAQNKDALNTSLRTELKDIADIRIDINQTSADTQKDDQRQRKSRGEYIPEEDQI